MSRKLKKSRLIERRNTGERYIMTTNLQLAIRAGYIGQTMIRPNFLSAVIRIILGGNVTRPIHVFYGGVPDARVRKLFDLPEPVKDAYE